MMASFAGATNFSISGGNFGYVGGNVTHHTYTGLPNQLLVPSNIHNPTGQVQQSSIEPADAQTASPPNSQSTSTTSSPTPSSSSLSSDRTHQDTNSSTGNTAYSTAPSSIRPTSPQYHPQAYSSALSSISLPLNQLPTTPNIIPSSQQQTPKSPHSNPWHDPSLGYSHRRGQSLEIPPRYPPNQSDSSVPSQPQSSPRPHQLGIPQTPSPRVSSIPSGSGSSSRARYDYQPPNGPIGVPHQIAAANAPSIPYHTRPRDSENDFSTEFARLQSQSSTQVYAGYPNLTGPATPRINNNDHLHSPAGHDYNQAHSDRIQTYAQGHYPPTPTNDLGLYTTPSQPNIPPLSALPHSYSPHLPPPQQPHRATTQPPPLPFSFSGIPQGPHFSSIPPWPAATAVGTPGQLNYDLNAYEHENLNSTRGGGVIDSSTHQRGGYAEDPSGSLQARNDFSTGIGSTPHVHREVPFGGGAIPVHSHTSSPFILQTPNSPFIANMRERDQLREPGFNLDHQYP